MPKVKIEVVKGCDIDVEKLVWLVRSRTMLYDHNLKEYHNKELTNELWKEVASQLRVPVTVCKNKWHSLRCGYARYLRMAKRLTSGYAHRKGGEWHLAGLLSFLKKFMGHPKKRMKLHDDEESSLGDDHEMYTDDTPEVMPSENAEVQEVLDFDVTEDSSHLNSTVSSDYLATKHDNKIMEISQPNKRSEVAVQTQTDFSSLGSLPSSCQSKNRLEMVVQPVTNFPITSYPLNLDDGAYLHFFKSLLPDIGKLDERLQRKFKEDVLRTLNHYLDEQDARGPYQIVSYSSITPSDSISYSPPSPHPPTVSLDLKIESESDPVISVNRPI